MVWYKISFCDEDTHLSQAFAELQSISRCLSWHGYSNKNREGEANHQTTTTKQCKNCHTTADGGPEYVDGIFSWLNDPRLIDSIRLHEKFQPKLYSELFYR